MMKSLAKSMLPRPVLDFVREQRKRQRDQRFFSQALTRVRCGAYELEIPENHILLRLIESQPFRDHCVGIAAKYLSAKYPDATMIDVGANIGDTAAMMATHAKNKLILIEASPYFHDILLRNVKRFPNEVVVKNTLVSDGRAVTGSFHHWGGTASFTEATTGGTRIGSVRLRDAADPKTCFVKTDTDGYDFAILMDSMDWLASVRAGVLFENQIRTAQELAEADRLCVALGEAGYRHFVVWDDAGYHMLSTDSVDALRDLNRYLFKVWQYEGPKSIFNYDVLCLHPQDEDVFEQVRDWFRHYGTESSDSSTVHAR